MRKLEKPMRQIGLRLPPDLVIEMDAACERLKTDYAKILREALRDWLKKQPTEPVAS